MVWDTTGAQIIPDEIQTIDANNLDVIFGIATSGKVCATIGGVSTSSSFSEDFTIVDTNLTTQQNCNVDIGTETVATVSTTNYTAAFFDYVLSDSTNYRAGTVMSIWDGTESKSADTSTVDLGDTSGVTLFTDIDGTNARLRATVTSNDWKIKTFVRALDLNSCICIAPTILSVVNDTGGTYTVNFSLNNNTDAVSTTIEVSEDNITWTASTGSTTSPRTITSGDGTSTRYFRMKTTCSDSVNSAYSNTVEVAGISFDCTFTGATSAYTAGDCTFTGADSDYTADCGQSGGSATYQA